MSGFGQETFEKIGSGITVSADGSPIAKAGGITIAWEAISAFAKDALFESFDSVYAGEKYLRYGTIMVLVATGTAAGKYVPAGLPVVAGVADTFGPASNVSSLDNTVFARGAAFILNRSVHENDRASDHCEAIDGGRVFKKRISMVGSTAPTYADTTAIAAAVHGTDTVTVAQFEGCFGDIRYVADALPA